MVPESGTFRERVSELIGPLAESGQPEAGEKLRASTDKVAFGIKPTDAQAARILNGWHMRAAGKITHQQLDDGLAIMWADRAVELLKKMDNYELFKFTRHDLSLENFLLMGDEDRKHDYAVWCELKSVVMLARMDGYRGFGDIEKQIRKWINPPIEYRQQFLDERGNVVLSAPKGLEEEWRRLKQAFGY